MIMFTSVCVFLLTAIALVVPSGFSLGAAMLLLGSIVLLRKDAPRFRLGRKDYLLIASLTTYFILNVALNLYHRASISEYDPPLRFFLAIPALLLLLAYPPQASALWSGLAIGAIGAGVYAAGQTLLDGIPRADGSTNPIQYGNISLLLGILCLAGIAWSNRQAQCRIWTGFLCAGALCGIIGALFTGSRGSWIALPACLVLLAVQHRSAGKRLLVGGTIGVCIVFAVLWLIPQSELRARMREAIVEAHDYASTGDADSSVGARLEMWRIGASMLPGHWLLGWGKQGMFDHKAELIQQGKAAAIVKDHTHLHNEYLDALVKRGLPGLFAVLVLYLTPLLLFCRYLNHPDAVVRDHALAGTLVIMSYLAFGLTQAFLTHNNGVMMLAFLTVIFWAGLRTREQQEKP